MKNYKRYALQGLLMVSLCAGAATIAHAQEQESPLDVSAWLSFQYIGEDNGDLGAGSEDPEDSFSQQLQLFAEYTFNPDTQLYFHGRALNIEGETGFDDDTGEAVPLDQAFAELRELFLRHENMFGNEPAYFQIGRQRIYEPRALWWNSDQDLVKVGYDSTLFSSFIAAGEDLGSYRNNTNSDYQEDDQDRFRVLGEVSWQYAPKQFLEARALYEDDHSGIESAGTVISADDRDNEDQNLLWAGVRAAGEVREEFASLNIIRYRGDLIGLFGEEDLVASTSGPGTNQRTVTGARSRDVRAWAFDGTLSADPYEGQGPVFSLGYAFGSGEKDPNGTDTDTEFRQTDLDGNSSRLGLERNQRRNYGEVLRPELSNLHILSAAVDYPFSEYSDINVTYFNYSLVEEATSMRSTGISAPMNGTDKDLGQAVDVGLYVDLDDQFNMAVPYSKDTDFRIVAGSFFPGDAYEPNGDNTAFRLFSEVKFKF